MRVGFLTSSYPDDENHPRGIFIHRLARGLVDEGLEVEVVAPGSDSAPPREVRDGVRIRRLAYWRSGGQRLTRDLSGIAPALVESPWLVVQLATLFGRFLQGGAWLRDRCDVVHAHWLYPGGLAAVLACLRSDRPVVLTSHGGDLALARRNALARWVGRLVTVRGDFCIGVSPRDRDMLIDLSGGHDRAEKDLGGPPVDFIPVGVDLEQFSASSGQRELEDLPDAGAFAEQPGLRVLYVGSLVRHKSIETLIDAVHTVGLEGREISCAIVGGGPLEEGLRLRAGRKRLGGVRFVGPRPPTEVPRWMEAADVLVLPSTAEGWGSVVVEAMATETPVVVSEAAGVATLVVSGRTGFLFPPGDEQALAQHLVALAEMTPVELRSMGDAARQAVREHRLGTSDIARRHLEVYRTVLARG